jgi:Na+-translocating ferredoxin:NAD+ oxidoreductase RnfD subunit
LWPFILCGLISISSKYVLRLGNRHLWNPTNFGVSVMLFLAPASTAFLNVQAGNNGWAVVVIWILGGMSMYRLGLWHIPLTFVAAFVPLAYLRSYVTGDPWKTEVAPITSPMFQLFIFFMITDPKTIVRGKKKQIVVVLLIAAMETYLRLAYKDILSLFHALFIVGPVANLVEIYFDRRKKREALCTPVLPASSVRPAAVDGKPQVVNPGMVAQS